ncbi:hypothetical protein BC828DRAFT_404449 [Blastocladiella britannica]|nr:hypothetical protein BC828DRAFT_404449 [Blastocladiella britannica]
MTDACDLPDLDLDQHGSLEYQALPSSSSKLATPRLMLSSSMSPSLAPFPGSARRMLQATPPPVPTLFPALSSIFPPPASSPPLPPSLLSPVVKGQSLSAPLLHGSAQEVQAAPLQTTRSDSTLSSYASLADLIDTPVAGSPASSSRAHASRSVSRAVAAILRDVLQPGSAHDPNAARSGVASERTPLMGCEEMLGAKSDGSDQEAANGGTRRGIPTRSPAVRAVRACVLALGAFGVIVIALAALVVLFFLITAQILHPRPGLLPLMPTCLNPAPAWPTRVSVPTTGARHVRVAVSGPGVVHIVPRTLAPGDTDRAALVLTGTCPELQLAAGRPKHGNADFAVVTSDTETQMHLPGAEAPLALIDTVVTRSGAHVTVLVRRAAVLARGQSGNETASPTVEQCPAMQCSRPTWTVYVPANPSLSLAAATTPDVPVTDESGAMTPHAAQPLPTPPKMLPPPPGAAHASVPSDRALHMVVHDGGPRIAVLDVATDSGAIAVRAPPLIRSRATRGAAAGPGTLRAVALGAITVAGPLAPATRALVARSAMGPVRIAGIDVSSSDGGGRGTGDVESVGPVSVLAASVAGDVHVQTRGTSSSSDESLAMTTTTDKALDLVLRGAEVSVIPFSDAAARAVGDATWRAAALEPGSSAATRSWRAVVGGGSRGGSDAIPIAVAIEAVAAAGKVEVWLG